MDYELTSGDETGARKKRKESEICDDFKKNIDAGVADNYLLRIGVSDDGGDAGCGKGNRD
jgi:hypothetical protein